MRALLETMALREAGEEAMSVNMEEAVERQRKLLYASKTNEQLIMVALHRVLVLAGYNGSALLDELDYRYRRDLEEPAND